MFKHIALLSRGADVTHEAFLDRLRESDLPEAIDGCVRFHEVVPTMPEHAEFDALVECFFEEETAYDAVVESRDGFLSGRNDAFADAIGAETGMAGEVIVQRDDVDGDTDGLYKHSAFLVRKADLTHEDFVDHWQHNHTPIAREITGVVKYDTVVPTAPDDQPFDGVAELYFEELEALYDALGSEGDRDYVATGEMAEKARADVDNFLAIDERPRLIGRERLVRLDR